MDRRAPAGLNEVEDENQQPNQAGGRPPGRPGGGPPPPADYFLSIRFSIRFIPVMKIAVVTGTIDYIQSQFTDKSLYVYLYKKLTTPSIEELKNEIDSQSTSETRAVVSVIPPGADN